MHKDFPGSNERYVLTEICGGWSNVKIRQRNMFLGGFSAVAKNSANPGIWQWLGCVPAHVYLAFVNPAIFSRDGLVSHPVGTVGDNSSTFFLRDVCVVVVVIFYKKLGCCDFHGSMLCWCICCQVLSSVISWYVCLTCSWVCSC